VINTLFYATVWLLLSVRQRCDDSSAESAADALPARMTCAAFHTCAAPNAVNPFAETR
jgi:hypothetical protein